MASYTQMEVDQSTLVIDLALIQGSLRTKYRDTTTDTNEYNLLETEVLQVIEKLAF